MTVVVGKNELLSPGRKKKRAHEDGVSLSN
jgi:hypothetical protein